MMGLATWVWGPALHGGSGVWGLTSRSRSGVLSHAISAHAVWPTGFDRTKAGSRQVVRHMRVGKAANVSRQQASGRGMHGWVGLQAWWGHSISHARLLV